MNDFTREELQSLLWAIRYVRERTNNCGDAMRSLRTKIQSIINDQDDEKAMNEPCPHEDINMEPVYQCEHCKKYVSMS